MTKSMYVAIVILLLLFAGCAVFIVLLQKDELQKDVQYFLLRHKLQSNISYKSVSVSFTDVAVLNGVEIKSSPAIAFKNKINRFTIRNYQTMKTIPSAFSASVQGVQFSLLDAVRSLNQNEEELINQFSGFDPVTGIFTAPLQAFLLAGCEKINADANIGYSYFPESKQLNLRAGFNDKCLGRWNASVSFDNITNAQQGRLITALQNLLKKGYPASDISEFLNGAVVTNISFSYTESRFIKGYKKYADTLYLRLPDQPSPSEPGHKGIQKIVTYLSFSNAHRQRNTEIARTVAAFIKNPDRINIQSKPGKQVPLKILSGDTWRKITELLLRMDVSVTIQNSAFDI